MIKNTPSPSKTDILKQWYVDVWENGNLDVIEDYFLEVAHNTNGGENHLVPGFGVDPKELREWLSILHSFVTDIKVDVLRTIEQGDWISAVLRITCRQRETSNKIEVIQQITLRFEGDKKVESYPSFDFIRFFEQLGQLPKDTHALLLSGTVLR